MSSPDVREHQQEGEDDDGLENLPVAAEIGQPRHQQLAAQHHEAGHHGHGKAPSWQAELNPWQREDREEANKEGVHVLLGFLQKRCNMSSIGYMENTCFQGHVLIISTLGSPQKRDWLSWMYLSSRFEFLAIS